MTTTPLPPIEHVPFTIKHQGAAVPNEAWYRYKSEKCLVIELDMRSKYTDLGASSGNQVFIEANEQSLHLDDAQPRDSYTVVEFALPDGDWQLCHGGRSGRYSLSFTYLKEIA